jgi:hypothetical protein
MDLLAEDHNFPRLLDSEPLQKKRDKGGINKKQRASHQKETPHNSEAYVVFYIFCSSTTHIRISTGECSLDFLMKPGFPPTGQEMYAPQLGTIDIKLSIDSVSLCTHIPSKVGSIG